MFFILTSRWHLGFFYHHENLASAFDLYFAFANTPPVVQHTWSSSYEPSRSQQLSSVRTEHMNFPARTPTREHQNMNLPAHIITCSPPAMNLLAHDTINIS